MLGGEWLLMAVSLSREFLLVAACSIWPPSDRRTKAIRLAAAGPLDWNRLLRIATRHRVVGLVHDGLTYLGPAVPESIAQEIASRLAVLVNENLALAAEAMRLQRLFAQADIPVVFIKGASLAMLAYRNLGMRQGQDIDLLVPYENVPGAIALVARAGYRRSNPPSGISDAQLRLVMPLRKDFGFVHEATGLPIELHWRLFLNPHAMIESSIMPSSRIVRLNGAAGLRTLDDENLFAYLCMHGALHCWNRLQWLADINALLALAPTSLEHLVRSAEARGAGRAAAQGVLLCQRLLGAPVPIPLAERFCKDAILRWLQDTALKAITTGQGEQHPHDVRFGTTRGSLSTFILGHSWRYRFAELNLHLTNQTDILAVPLPERLRFLYPLLRLPLWVWRHSAKRRVKQ
jgi:hypothetical protein